MTDSGMNGDTVMKETSHESSAINIDSKSLSTRKVIQVKIDNPFLSNDESDEENFSNNPFCIKVSKGSSEEVTNKVPVTNGDRSNSGSDEKPEADKDLDNKVVHGKVNGELFSEQPVNNEAKNDSITGGMEHSEEKPQEEGDDKLIKERSEEAMAEDDSSQVSSVSGSAKGDTAESESNFGDIEDENSRGSIKLSEKLDNEKSHELSQVIETNTGVSHVQKETGDSEVEKMEVTESLDKTKDLSETKESESAEKIKDNGNEDNKVASEDSKLVINNTESKMDIDVAEKSDKDVVKNSEAKENIDRETNVDSDSAKMTDAAKIPESEKGDTTIVTEKISENEKEASNVMGSKPAATSEKNTDSSVKADDSNIKDEDSKMDDSENNSACKRESKDGKDSLVTDSDNSSNIKLQKETKSAENTVEDKSDKIDMKQEEKEKSASEGSVSVEKVKDEDGTDILITVNEDHSDNEENRVSPKTEVQAPPPEKSFPDSKVEQKNKIKSIFENDVVIVDLSAESPKEEKVQPTPIAPQPLPNAPTFNFMPSQAQNIVQINGVQYVQQIMQDTKGRKQIVQVPLNNSNKHLYSHLVSQGPTTPRNTQPMVQITCSVPPKPQTGLKRFKTIDDDVPIASWEQLDLIKYEMSIKKYDNTFWAGQCPVNKKAELSAPTKFLLELGSDIVKQSAYDQIVKVQGRKDQEGKLGQQEQENLKKMKNVVKELKEKLHYLQLKEVSCEGCNFVTESENVLQFHKEHPHMDPPMDPFGDMTCSITGCDLKTRNPEAFALHMEKEHQMKARVYDKPEIHKCSLCYYESKAKNQLTKHKFRCIKNFKPIFNQAPHYTDINYCLKTVFYKYQVKKNVVPQQPRSVAPPVRPQPKIIRPPIRNFTPQGSHRPPILQPKNSTVNANFMPIVSNRPVVLSNAAGMYRPISVSNPPVQLVQGVPVINTSVLNTNAKPTVNELLKQKTQASISANQKPKVPVAPAPQVQKTAFEVCEICGGYVKDKMSLRIHFFYAHKVDLPAALFSKNPPLSCDVCKTKFWTTQGLTKHKYSLKHHTPQNVPAAPSKPVVKCWICQQSPENLYAHIHKFHRLSTSECMALRRCMFCGILSNTRRDLEVHMAAIHGVLIKGEQNKVTSKPPSTGLVRNNFCVFCSKQFSDNTQLTLHCLRDHATCSACGMVVANASQLKTHVCKNATNKKCQICGIKNLKSQYYIKHVATHLKKCSVKLKRLTDREIEQAMGKKRKMEMDMADQKAKFTQMEAEIWNEIELRRKRADDRSPETKKRKLESEIEEKLPSKQRKFDDRNCKSTAGVVVLDD